MANFKTPIDLANNIMALNRENRRNTLNKRINFKGNTELSVTGGERALDNQAQIWDKNNVANTMVIAEPHGIGGDWTLAPIKNDIEGMNNRYENRNGQNIEYSPKTKRGRRLSTIFSNQRGQENQDGLSDQQKLELFLQLLNKYEGVK